MNALNYTFIKLFAIVSPSVLGLEPNIFVFPDGNDSNKGTKAQPLASLESAINRTKPGDEICLRGGTYHPTKAIKFNKSGTKEKPIVISTHPNEKVVISGEKMNNQDPMWTFRKVENWKIKGPLTLTKGPQIGSFEYDEAKTLKN